MRQCQHWRACATTSVSTYTKLNTPPRLGSLKMVQLSAEVQLIKAVCTAEMLRIGFSQKPKIVPLCVVIQKCCRGNTNRNNSGGHNKGIVCRYVVASNRAQVVRSYTCVTTTQASFPYPLSPAPIVVIERVSHVSHCIEHLCPDTHPTNSPHEGPQSFKDSSLTLTKIGDGLRCISLLSTLVLFLLLVTCRGILSSVQHDIVQLPQLSQSVDKL